MLVSKAATQNQSHGGIEQSCYVGKGIQTTMIPKIYYENNNKWYAEARYNYEEQQTFSLIAGKVFSKKSNLSYSVTPMAGFAVGNFNGALLGMKIEMEHNNLFFSSESQYGFSVRTRREDFFYSWSDAGYQVRSWIYAGLAMQLTITNEASEHMEPGIFIGFPFKKWTFPVYIFNPAGKNMYAVLGITYEWGSHKQ